MNECTRRASVSGPLRRRERVQMCTEPDFGKLGWKASTSVQPGVGRGSPSRGSDTPRAVRVTGVSGHDQAAEAGRLNRPRGPARRSELRRDAAVGVEGFEREGHELSEVMLHQLGDHLDLALRKRRKVGALALGAQAEEIHE